MKSEMILSEYPLIVVGSGFYGLTIAEHFARIFQRKVLVIEKRNHIGGNAWSEVDTETGIEIHKYGTHIFHTESEKIWQYVNRFSQFTSYEHRVWTRHGSSFFQMPVNLSTMSSFFNLPLDPDSAREFINGKSKETANDSNDSFENRAINKIGSELYGAFFRGYTLKQWQVDPSKLPGEVFSRLPIRFNFDGRYFNDKYQGLPKNGYHDLFNNMVQNNLIDIILDTDFHNIEFTPGPDQILVYTGPIDKYFNFKHGILGWRTLDFSMETLDKSDFQGTSVVNYPDLDVDYTRIHEFKHLHPERNYVEGKTIVAKEYSRVAGKTDEPYYPTNLEEDRAVLLLYRQEMEREKNVVFGGRLGSYKYLDMHMAIGSAISQFENHIKPFFEKNIND
jgi:UDP-galactopyranose mutase